MRKKNVVVILGGYSLEYEVSLVLVSAVIYHMDKPVLDGITYQGNWTTIQAM